MKAQLNASGIGFIVDEYQKQYGNESFLKLQKKYTIRTIDKITKIPKRTVLYDIHNLGSIKVIVFPRHCDLIKNPPTKVRPISEIVNCLPIVPKLDMNYIGQSNHNQLIVIDEVMKRFTASYAGVTIKLLAGCGKTYCAMDIIGRMKMKTLIVVPNTYLLDQWVGLLTQYFPESKIGVLYGKEKKDGDIVVSIINSASSMESYIDKQKNQINVGEYFKQFGLAIFDESQMYVSKEFKKVFSRIHSRYTIGLSATPDIREDKLDPVHLSWIGPILDAELLPGYEKRNDSFESEIKMIKYHSHSDHCKFSVREDGMIEYSSIIESLITDPNRNNIIVNEVLNLMEDGRFVFVFSDRRSHLEHLFELMEKEINVREKTDIIIDMPEFDKKIEIIGERTILYGGSKEDVIEKARSLSSIILTTYAYSGTGVSITKMDALVLSTPRRSNMKQIINRVFRLGSDQTIKRIIIDIVDEKMPIKGQVRERVKAYEERGSIINKSIIKV